MVVFPPHCCSYLLLEMSWLPQPDRVEAAFSRYNMEWLRAEGFAVASEELFMIAGALDDRPQRGREIPYLMVSCAYCHNYAK